MGPEFWFSLGSWTAAFLLLAHLIYCWRQGRAAGELSISWPWREGGYWRLSVEDQRTVRRAVRRGEALHEPRLAEAAWRMAEKIAHQQGRYWHVRIHATTVAMQSFVLGALSTQLMPLWVSVLFPVAGVAATAAMLRWNSVRTVPHAELAAERNRAVVEGGEHDGQP